MSLINQKSDNSNNAIELEKIARSKFIINSLILVLFMFASVIISCFLRKKFFDEILLIDQHLYGTLTLLLWSPFFLLSIAILIFSSFLDCGMQRQTERDSQRTVFTVALRELRAPTEKKTKRRTILFWVFIAVSVLSFVASQLLLILGMLFYV